MTTMFFSGLAFGQVDILWDDDPGVAYNGDTVEVVADVSGYNVYMHVENTSGSTMDIKFRRVILNSTGGSFTDQLCDDFLCYNCSGTDWTSPQSISIDNADSTIMKPVFNFSTGGSAEVRYYVLDAGNGDAIVDSVDLHLTSVLSVEEDINISLSAYPNPASDEFFVNFNGNEGMNFNLVVYNVIGEEVMHRNIVNGLNTITVADLNNGVYFYSIVTNNDVIETKKLVVRH